MTNFYSRIDPARMAGDWLGGISGAAGDLLSGVRSRMGGSDGGSGPSSSLRMDGVSETEAGGGGTPSPQGGPNDAFLRNLAAQGYIPVPGRPGIFFNPETGDEYDTNAKAGGPSGNDGSAWGAIAENARQFNATQARLAGRDVVQDAQWTTSFDEGKRQFQANYDRSAFVTDRAYKQAEDQFAKNYAENKRQFDTRLTADLDMFDANLMSEEGRFIAQAEANANTERARLGLTAEQMALDASRFDRQSSLEEKKNRQEILRNPSDFISRAFEQRGETAPTARITHADLINEVAREANASRQDGATAVANARRMAESVKAPVFTPTVPKPRTTLIPPPATTSPPPTSSPASFGGLGDLTASSAPAWQDWAASYNAANAPKMAEGGMTQANMVMTGDSPKGEEGKENEELVIDLPDDGGLLVIPKDRLIGKRKRMADAAPKAATGGLFDTPGTMVNQEDIEATAREFAPPAVRDLVGGGRMASFRPAVSALTPRRLAMMNTGEQTAFNSYLGVAENTTLEDELSGIAPLFGPSVSRARTRMAVGG